MWKEKGTDRANWTRVTNIRQHHASGKATVRTETEKRKPVKKKKVKRTTEEKKKKRKKKVKSEKKRNTNLEKKGDTNYWRRGNKYSKRGNVYSEYIRGATQANHAAKPWEKKTKQVQTKGNILERGDAQEFMQQTRQTSDRWSVWSIPTCIIYS